MTKQKQVILIIDDNITNLKVVMEYLQAYSFEVLVARSGSDGLESAEIAGPDLILLDVQMPGVDGFETCRRLKANPLSADIPVIFMTALTDIADKVRGFDAGAVDYVTKPIQEKELLARVQTHLALRELQSRLEEKVLERTKALDAEVLERRKAVEEKEQLLNVVRSQSDQLHSLTQQLIGKDIDHDKNELSAENEALIKLSTREYEVFQLLAQGKTNAEVAKILTVTSATISTYRNRISNKLGLPNAAALHKYLLNYKSFGKAV